MDTVVATALRQLADGDEATAKRHDATLKTDPKFTSALHNTSIFLENDDLEEAVELYQRTIAIDPDLAAAHMRLGFALLYLGKIDEAEKHLSTGVKLDPSTAVVKAPSCD